MEDSPSGLVYVADNIAVYPAQITSNEAPLFEERRDVSMIWSMSADSAPSSCASGVNQIIDIRLPEKGMLPLHALFGIVDSMSSFLAADPKNFCVVNCPDRGYDGSLEGVVVVCYKLLVRAFAEASVAFAWWRRFKNMVPLSPSQKSYVEYFCRILCGAASPGLAPSRRLIRSITVRHDNAVVPATVDICSVSCSSPAFVRYRARSAAAVQFEVESDVSVKVDDNGVRFHVLFHTAFVHKDQVFASTEIDGLALADRYSIVLAIDDVADPSPTSQEFAANLQRIWTASEQQLEQQAAAAVATRMKASPWPPQRPKCPPPPLGKLVLLPQIRARSPSKNSVPVPTAPLPAAPRSELRRSSSLLRVPPTKPIPTTPPAAAAHAPVCVWDARLPAPSCRRVNYFSRPRAPPRRPPSRWLPANPAPTLSAAAAANDNCNIGASRLHSKTSLKMLHLAPDRPLPCPDKATRLPPSPTAVAPKPLPPLPPCPRRKSDWRPVCRLSDSESSGDEL
eukprot:m51a1_g5457 hypothetical protein (508) ;mRNA; r:230036-232072